MNRYETVGIIRPDVGDDVIKGVISRAAELLTSNGGNVVKLDEWGRRRMAYPIAKKNEGYYFVLTYSSLPETSKEMERTLKLNEDVLRYQTVRLDDKAPWAGDGTPAAAESRTAGEPEASEEEAEEGDEYGDN